MFLRARNTRSNTPWLLAAVTAAWITVPHARGVVIDQLDDFQDSTTQGWGIGAGPQPEIMTDGGPLGASDRFMMMTADGSSSGGRLTVFNRSQWLGDYIAAGVTAVQIDLRNFSTQTLTIRIAFKNTTSPGSAGFSSATGFSLPADGQWHTAVFPITAAGMAPVFNPGDFNTFMMNPAEMRILHATSPSVTGNSIVAQMGVDNIRAIPAPGAAALLVSGAALAFRRRRVYN
jgi:hypothetical protein